MSNKKRIIIAAVLLILAVICIFAGIKINEKQNEKISLVTVSSNIRKGDIIESENLSSITVGSINMNENYAVTADDIIGKYALADLYEGDFILLSKTADSLATADEKLLKLDGSRVAISVEIKSFAKGLSDKIVGGDIVSCIVTTEDVTQTPSELTYVEVLTTTMPSGADKDNSGDTADENLSTATLLATPRQAQLLAGYDVSSIVHLALVYRGDEESAQEFLDKQTEISAELTEPEIPISEEEAADE